MEIVEEQINTEAKKKHRHECDICGETFATNFNLKRHHEQIHTQKLKMYSKHIKKDNKYQCKLCEM